MRYIYFIREFIFIHTEFSPPLFAGMIEIVHGLPESGDG